MMSKRFFNNTLFFVSAVLLLGGCSTNQATGENQFTAFMSPAQEKQIGAEEHRKVLSEYGLYKDQNLQSYVQRIGKTVTKNTERRDVDYQFYLLDSPIVNAFALPGGYIYLTRGLMSLSNSEAEMAAVLAHEAGHITGKHSAERYSRGVATSIGASILSAVIDSSGVSQALGMGSNLYMKSYSRGQESQADTLGIRYLARSGYNTQAMPSFLSNLQASGALESKLDGASNKGNSFFSTHPATGERVSKTIAQAGLGGGVVNRDPYLRMIDGMIYGDSIAQGLIRGNVFAHPEMGFIFSVPEGYRLKNSPSQVVARARGGSVIIFDIVGNKERVNPMRFLKDIWMKGQPVTGAEKIKVHGMKAATAGITGTVNNKAAQLQLVAIQWSPTQIVRFQVVLPSNPTSAQLNSLKSSTYSFKRMNAADKRRYSPYRIKVIAAKRGDNVAKLAKRMAQDDHQKERFRVLNGMKPRDKVIAGHLYKLVVE